MIYYGTRISENMSIREPEGYLICKDVPIARTGMQKYLASELELEGDRDRLIPVQRPEEEVFSKACIASFEGMPFTDNHPSDGVDKDNISYLQKGHAQNIRRGVGEHANELIADIIVTDPFVIQEIQNGKREISCGYNFELSEERGQFVQRQIRGNHVALVDQGRAGHSVCIKDSKPNIERKVSHNMKNQKNSMLFRMFKSFVNDADTTTEEIETAADEIQEIQAAMEATEPDKAAKSLATVPGAAANTKVEDEDTPAMPDKQDQIIALLKQLVEQKGADEEVEPAPELPETTDAEEDPLDKLAAEVTPDEEPKGPTEAESHFVSPEEMNEEDEDPEADLPMENVPTEDEFPDEVEEGKEAAATKVGKDAAVRMAIDAIRPYIASLPKNQRRAAADAAVKQLRTQMGKDSKASKNGYIAIKSAKRSGMDSAAQDDNGRALGKKIQAARNCNYKK